MSGSLFDAAQRGDEDEARGLLEAGADANELGPDQRTPLIEAAARGHLGLVRLLLERGAEPAWKDAQEETALLKAAANGHRAVYDALWPLAGDDERGLAKAFLSASGLSWDAPVAPPPPPPAAAPPKSDRFARVVATAASRVSKFFGDEVHAERMERMERAESQDPKKRR